jgi:hypothetical protein
MAAPIGVPHISIRHGIRKESQQAAVRQSLNRKEWFSPEALTTAWETYIQTHPTAHILINTMRASMPRLTDPTTFVIAVQNQKQLELMEANRPALLDYLRDKLSNDSISFSVTISQGEMPRHTLNDGELLKKMVDEYPSLKNLIDDFKLRLS